MDGTIAPRVLRINRSWLDRLLGRTGTAQVGMAAATRAPRLALEEIPIQDVLVPATQGAKSKSSPKPATPRQKTPKKVYGAAARKKPAKSKPRKRN